MKARRANGKKREQNQKKCEVNGSPFRVIFVNLACIILIHASGKFMQCKHNQVGLFACIRHEQWAKEDNLLGIQQQ